jgi:hypothetical protein
MALDSDAATACHWLLLRLAGHAPDDLIAQCRQWLGQGRLVDVGRAATFAVLSQRMPIRLDDADLLADLLAEADGDTSSLSMVDILDEDPIPRYGFAPRRDQIANALGGEGPTRSLMTSDEPEDDIDGRALATVAGLPGIRAFWRTWRFPGERSPWPPPRRVYVVESDAVTDPWVVAATLQDALTRVGEDHPQIESYRTRDELPSYQQLARACGALLWARDPDPGIRVAMIFDEFDDDGPRMSPDHPKIAADEAAPLIDYLRNGEPLLVSTTTLVDVVEPDREPDVPISLFTDGYWVWNAASTYFLEEYGLLPDPDLVAHVRQRRYEVPVVDGAGMHRALAAFQESVAAGPG